VNYTVIDNGVLYNAGYNGCDPQSTYSYNINGLPQGGGPYQLTDWLVNGQLYNGNFLNLAGLIALMNQLDPSHNWKLQGSTFIRGGNLSSTYGSLKVKSATANTANYDPALQQVPQGTELRFSPGQHKVIFRNVLNACADTAVIDVQCFDCLPVHSYALNAQGNRRRLLGRHGVVHQYFRERPGRIHHYRQPAAVCQLYQLRRLRGHGARHGFSPAAFYSRHDALCVRPAGVHELSGGWFG
jgi:hypothetical protein